MAVEVDAEKLVKNEQVAIAGFFGTEVPAPTDRLFEVAETNRQQKLFNNPKILYVPRRSFPEGTTFPGQRVPMSSNLYRYMKEELIDADANSIPGQWMIFDTTMAEDYNGGKQMYSDTPRFRDLLADLRDQNREAHIEIPDYCKDVPKDSRFAISADEIDGSRKLVTMEVANILKLQPGEEVSTPPYSVFYYVGNLDSSLRLGDFTIFEWFKNRFEGGLRLVGGDSDFGGLSSVDSWQSGLHDDCIGFRLQVAFPSQTA